MDAAHLPKQPLTDRSLGIVVQRRDAPLRAGAFPGLPDRVGSRLRHIEPSGHLLIFQQTVSRLYIDLLQHIQNQRRGQKSRSQPPAVMIQRLQQALLRVLLLLLVQKPEVQRAHQGCLPVRIQSVLRRPHQRLISQAHLLLVEGEDLLVLLLAQLPGDLLHQPHHIHGVGGGHFRMGRDHIGPLVRMHVRRLRPLPVGLPGVDRVFFRLAGKMQTLREESPLSAPPDHEAGVLFHGGIVIGEYLPISVNFPEPIGDHDARVRPAHGTVHGLHVGIHAARRSDLGESSLLVFRLPVAEILFKFSGKGRVIQKVGCRVKENLGISGPAVALSRGTVRGDIRRIVPGGPQGTLHQAVEELVGTVKERPLLHVRVDRDSREILRLPVHIRLNLYKLKAEDRKAGLVVILPLFAGIAHLLQRRCLFLVGTLNIFLGKLPVLIQHLPKAQEHLLPFLRRDGKRDVSGDILTEIQHGFAPGRNNDLGRKVLLLPDPHIVGCRGNHVAGGYPDAAPGSVGLPPGVHNLPVLVIGKADRPLIAPEKRAVGSDHLNGSVLQCNLQLCQKLRLHAVLAGQSPGAHTAPIPAVSQGEEQFILAGPQRLRHIIGLVLQTHSIVGNTGRQHKIAGTLPVDPGLVVSTGGHIQPGLPHLGGSVQRTDPPGTVSSYPAHNPR